VVKLDLIVGKHAHGVRKASDGAGKPPQPVVKLHDAVGKRSNDEVKPTYDHLRLPNDRGKRANPHRILTKLAIA